MKITSVGSSGGEAVFTYTKSADGWSQEQAIRLPDYNSFGYSVAFSRDNTLAVGAPLYYSDASDCGALLIYTKPGGVWSQETAIIMPSYVCRYSQFGYSLAFSENGTLAVGASGYSGNVQPMLSQRVPGNSTIQQSFLYYTMATSAIV